MANFIAMGVGGLHVGPTWELEGVHQKAASFPLDSASLVRRGMPLVRGYRDRTPVGCNFSIGWTRHAASVADPPRSTLVYDALTG